MAVTTGAALGALTRFATPRQRMPSLGRTPAASARGARRPQGSLTKTGQTHARRAGLAGAWASRSPAPGSRPLPRRLETLPTALQASSWQAQGRRCTRARPRMAKGKQAQQGGVASARAGRACMGAMAQQVAGAPPAYRGRRVDAHVNGCQPLSAETPPRCGGTRGGVRRPHGPRVPRMRQAPDGGQEGGSQPTDSRVIHRRVLPGSGSAARRDQGKKYAADVQQLLPTLDIGSHIIARGQPLGMAGAQRTLAAVGWTPLIMIEASPSTYPSGRLSLEKSHA